MPPPRKSSLHSMSISRRGSSVKAHLLEFDENVSVPAVPPLELMDTVPGYENITFEAVVVHPTPPPVETKKPSDHLVTYKHLFPIPITEITEDQVREALLRHVSKRCCYGTKPAKGLSFNFVQATYAFLYRLETFTERRESAWSFVPFNGNCEVDGSENGEAPLPWDIEVLPKALFESEVKSLRVPHTSSVKACHRCAGTGHIQCPECRAKGWIRCLTCNGEGFNSEQEICVHCRVSRHGFGRQDCFKCKATGKLPCPPCESSGLILCFIQLTITWKTNVSEKIIKKICIPEKFIQMSKGKEIFLEEGERVSPLEDLPDEEEICVSSANFIEKHSILYSDQKFLAQRQRVSVVPIADITYEWKGKEGQFFVYGIDNKIHAPDYPQTCCGCSVI
ncbi:protein SSUH2 homolog isoform X2 [Lycorma delicatula]